MRLQEQTHMSHTYRWGISNLMLYKYYRFN